MNSTIRLRNVRFPVQLIRHFNPRPVLKKVLRNSAAARSNAAARNSWVDFDELEKLSRESTTQQTAESESSSSSRKSGLSERLYSLVKALPNWTHEGVQSAEEPILLEEIGVKSDTVTRRMVDNAKGSGLLLQNAEYTLICGERTYFLTSDLVRFERALIRFTLDTLLKRGFRLISVPDLVTADEVMACGMNAKGKRSQVYHVDIGNGNKKLCLSGTAEMALANLFREKQIPRSALPMKVCSVSRCYRAEVSTIKEEKGLYRVHQFTKVEMFGLSEGSTERSQQLQQEFLDVERSLFSDLGLHFKVLDMPPADLGNPAFRKIDVEAWMNGHGFYGEISSTSDCTSYQANRLGITTEDGEYVHTVNGTACAVPRMLIALCETHVKPNGIFKVPPVLRPYLNDKDELRPEPAFRRWKYLPYYYFENRLLDENVNDVATDNDEGQKIDEKLSS